MRRDIILAAALIALAPIAGCVGANDDDGGPDPSANEAPAADLAVSREAVDTGERVTFDGRASDDPDGKIVSWVFDFGDGTEHEATDEDDARVTHAYAEGGLYRATLTVTDNGAESAGAESATDSVAVTANHKQALAPGVVVADVVPDEPEPSARNEQTFPVNGHAESIELNATFDSAVLVGSSEIRVEILDAAGDVLANQTVAVSSDDNATLDLAAVPTDPGDYVVRITAEEGAAQFGGEIRVFYEDTPDTDDEASAEP